MFLNFTQEYLITTYQKLSETYTILLFYLDSTKVKNEDKLRPIAVGGSIRRAFTSCTVKHNIKLFLEHLLPYNYAIGFKGGADFIYNTISLEIDKYVTRTNTTYIMCSMKFLDKEQRISLINTSHICVISFHY